MTTVSSSLSDRLADFSSGPVIKVNKSQLEEFVCIATENPNKKRYRLCLHESPSDPLQEMLICVTKGDYSRPHKHIGISESHHIISGAEQIILFDDEGRIKDTFILGWDDYISYRINSETYHMSIPLTDSVIKLEVKAGPFEKDSNIYPPWAPDGSDRAETEEYIKEVLKMTQEFAS